MKRQELVWALLETEKPVVLDADGINALSGHIDVLDARRDKVTVLTPHAVEFSRIGGDLSHGDRQQAARDFAMRHGCVLVLKGHGTVTAAPTGEVLVNTTGGSGLAKGGSGDVLTGVIASLLAQGVDAGAGGSSGRVAPRPGRRFAGSGADSLRRYAGGGCRASAAGHPGNFGITEGARCTLENVYQ